MLAGFCHGDKYAELTVERETQLRHIQQELCRLFGQRFPAMKACLNINGVTYDEFGDTPFTGCREDEAGS